MKTGDHKVEIEGGYLFEKGTWHFRSAFLPEPRIWGPAIVIIAAIVWYGANHALDWYWIVVPSLIIFFVGTSVIWRFTIEPQNGVVREQALLFARRVVKEQLMSFADFKYIFVDRKGPEGEEFRIFLQHCSGRKMLVKCESTPRGAEELAWRISCDTGIKMKGERD
ncbi:hypothetical protein [Pedosphaera parvula]|uniref:Uncharacterized protein n=1 Tax=Pedosphaera parvula (strain Ellin514) TaxID=320771 RepID=B9XEL6_PEDPL|nr:hypothetical protein [Pedosphaera parvula]EEF61730.1 hypothetical protein Cflav_PD4770 [Pedosphaera parvula Ellin514]